MYLRQAQLRGDDSWLLAELPALERYDLDADACGAQPVSQGPVRGQYGLQGVA